MERKEEGSTEREEKYKQTTQEFEDSGVTEVNSEWKSIQRNEIKWNIIKLNKYNSL